MYDALWYPKSGTESCIAIHRNKRKAAFMGTRKQIDPSGEGNSYRNGPKESLHCEWRSRRGTENLVVFPTDAHAPQKGQENQAIE